MNALHNREQAVRLFAAGFTAVEIVDLFGEVYCLGPGGGLTQRYDGRDGDRRTITVMVSSQAVSEAIASHREGNQEPAPRGQGRKEDRERSRAEMVRRLWARSDLARERNEDDIWAELAIAHGGPKPGGRGP